MPTKNLTVTAVHALQATPGRQVDYWDQAVPGFGIRVSSSGRKTWTVMYRHLGRLRRLTLGVFPRLPLADARQMAKDKLYEASKGHDPATEKVVERDSATFGDLAKEYMEKHAKKRKRSWKQDHRMLYGSPHKKRTGKRPHVPIVNLWGNSKLTEIRRADVRDLLDKVAERAPIQANRILAVVRKMFNFALDREWLEANPAAGLKRPALERQRDRVLSANEIAAVWSALESEHPTVRALFQLRLLTAQRGGEVQSMRWQDVDLEAAWWTIPAERSKNGLAHRVPLSAQAVEILKELKVSADRRNGERDDKSPWVFQSTRVGRPKPIEHAQKAIERVRKSATVDFRGHDLRRTAASLMVGSGTPRLVVSKILNHVETGVTAVYDRHSYDLEKRIALDAWGRRVQAIVDAKRNEAENPVAAGAHVVAFRPRV